MKVAGNMEKVDILRWLGWTQRGWRCVDFLVPLCQTRRLGGSGADAGSQSPGVGPLASISPGGSGHTHRF